MPLKSIASFGTAAGETRRCGGWEVLAWACPVLRLLFLLWELLQLYTCIVWSVMISWCPALFSLPLL